MAQTGNPYIDNDPELQQIYTEAAVPLTQQPQQATAEQPAATQGKTSALPDFFSSLPSPISAALNITKAGAEAGVPGFKTLNDMDKGIVSGAYNAVAETVNLLSDGVNAFQDKGSEVGDIINPIQFKGDTLAGQFAHSISQFATGLIGAGKVLKAAKLLQGAGRAVTFGRGMAQGAIADFTVFDANEERLSNLIQSNPALANPITEYLAAGKDDDGIEGRFKNALEGMALGAVAEGLFFIVKGIKASRVAKTASEAEDAVIKTADELDALAAKSGDAVEELGHKIEATVGGDLKAVDDVVMAAGGKVEVVVKGADAEAVTEAVESLATDATPAMKTAMTKSRLTPQQTGEILEEGLTSPKTMEEAMESGRFLTGNNQRLAFNTVEEAVVHAEHAEAVWSKTLIGKGVETFKKVLEGSEEFLKFMGVDDLLEVAARDKAWMKGMTARVLAYKEVAHSALEEMLDVRRLMELHGKTPELVEQLNKASRIFQDLSMSAKDMTTGAARVTSSGRITPRYMDGEVLADLMLAADGNLEKVMKVINLSRSRKTFNLTTEMVINGLLSSPKTHAVNTFGNLLKTALMPAEKMIGGMFMGNPQMVQEGAQTYVGLFKYLTESWRMASMAAKTGGNILDAGHRVMDSNHQTLLGTYEKVKDMILTQRGVTGGDMKAPLTALEKLQAHSMSFLGLPSRALLGMDEMFKQLNYRANVYGKLTAEGMTKFGSDTARISEFVENGIREAFENGGKGVNSDALRYAQETTWTQTLKDDAYFGGGLGQAMTNMVNQYPPLRLVAPFIRTPTNLIRDFVAHTPGLNMVTKRYRDAIQAGGERAAHAYGQMATGAMLWSTAIGLAASGSITGGYPKDPATRQAWIDSGIEPYSFKIGDKYISFARIDPFSTFFGIAADYAEYSRNWNDSVKGNWASGAILALGSNILSKSYLTGITDLIGALGDQSVDSKAMQKYLMRSATMFVPYSSGLRFTRQLVDDPLREVRSGFDSILNAIPGTSHLLPERRSWITGKPISQNLFWGEHKEDLVANELARLGDNLSVGAPGKKLKGIELNGEQYSRLCELQGTLKIGGLTQHERLTRLMKSPSYDIGRKKMPDMPGDIESPRTKAVEKVVQSYRKAAQQALLKGDKELQTTVEREFNIKRSARRGDANSVKALTTMPSR